MDRNLSFILDNCASCIELYQRLRMEYSFLFRDFRGRVKQCTEDQYGCDIWIEIKGVLIRFETAPRDGLELGYGVVLSVPDPNNQLNHPHFVTLLLDFIDNNPPSQYQELNLDEQINSPTQLENALRKIVDFYNSQQFSELAQSFNDWYKEYMKEFWKSVEKYYNSKDSDFETSG